jgi:hypothetical protein
MDLIQIARKKNKEVIGAFFVLCIVLLCSLYILQAQNKSSVPLLGSRQLVESSEFCRKYKCKAIPREYTEGLKGYVLELPNDETWSNIMSYPSSKGKTQSELWLKYRSLMYADVDEKTGQLRWVEFQLRGDFESNKRTFGSESVMLADAIYYTIGKRLTLNNSKGELYAPAVNDCFLFSRTLPEENISRLTRVMLTGEITLQIDRKKAKYQAIGQLAN